MSTVLQLSSMVWLAPHGSVKQLTFLKNMLQPKLHYMPGPLPEAGSVQDQIKDALCAVQPYLNSLGTEL